MNETPRLPFADINAVAAPTTPCPPTPAANDSEQRRWNADDADVIIGCQPATAVYTNQFGAIVICQESRLGEDDPFVYVQPTFLPQLIAALQQYLPR